MKIQIFCFSLSLMITGIVYAAVPKEAPKEPSKQEEPKTSPQDFKQLEDLTDFELSNIASKLPYADLGRFEGVSQRFQEIAQAEFKNRLGDAGYLWTKGDIIPNQFHAHEGQIAALFFSKDGSIVSVGEDDRHINVWKWDGNIYKRIMQLVDDVEDDFFRSAFSSESNRLALLHYNGVITTWDVQTGQKISRINAVNTSRLAFSPDGSVLATTTDYQNPGIINFWDVSTGTKTKEITAEMSGYHHEIRSIAFSPDGKHLASGQSFKREPITIWNVEDLTKEKQLKLNIIDAILLFLPDGKLIAYNDKLPITIWDAQTMHPIATLKYEHQANVEPMRLSHDANLFAGRPLGGNEKKVVIWHIQSGKILRELDTMGEAMQYRDDELAFSTDDKMLVAGCSNGDIMTWKAQPKKKEVKSTK